MSNPPPGLRVLAIVGPTAAGKSELAMRAAERLDAEIVNADAFCLYRGMDIGTAKPSLEERAEVRHHLIDILEVTTELSVAEYQRRGREVLVELGLRGVPAIVVGGSGLYLRALLDDLRFPGSDPAIRARWEQRLAELGAEGLHAVLAQRDPAAAEHILPSNGPGSFVPSRSARSRDAASSPACRWTAHRWSHITQSACGSTARSSTPESPVASMRCSTRVWWPRSSGCSPRACGRAAPRPERWGTRR